MFLMLCHHGVVTVRVHPVPLTTVEQYQAAAKRLDQTIKRLGL